MLNMKPEILAPVGNAEALEAALAAGCDAVYFALPVFGARAFAKNFTLEETRDVIRRCHLVGVKVYITMNTVLYEEEVEEAYALAKKLHEMHVDALIIQDLGFLHLLHHRLPNLTLHASTQISANQPIMIEQLKKLGVKRVVLARECTMDEIKSCVKTGMEIEVFLHGALCISYSGNCYFSSVRYGRSGNRGACSQPCRMPYRLLENGKPILKEAYYLSPKDLSLIDQVQELEKAGVVSLKIEGRMKSPSYVYEAIMQTRKALYQQPRSKQDLEDLMVTFNRGYTRGHAFDQRGLDLMNTKTCNHQGIVLGKVLDVHKNRIKLSLKRELHQNDGLRFGSELGCHVNFIYDESNHLTSCMPAGSICVIEGPLGVKKGDVVLKTTSFALDQAIEKKIKESTRQIPVSATIWCEGVGLPMYLSIFDGIHTVTVSSDEVAGTALKRATDEALLCKQMTKTKDSFAYFESIDINLTGGLFFTISSINALRRKGLEALADVRTKEEQIVEKEYAFQPSVSLFDQDLYEVLDPRQKLETEDLWACEMDGSKLNLTATKGLVVSHLQKGLIVDGLNITNSYGVAALLELGYERIVLSDECDYEHSVALASAFEARYGCEAPIYKTIYQRRRLMTMNHCPINTALKDGSRTNCALCHQNRYELLGRDKKKVLCIGDRDCHMCLYDENIVDEIDRIPDYLTKSIKNFKAVFTTESKAEVLDLVKRIHSRKA